jgi:SAM-dependent methyltransferase
MSEVDAGYTSTAAFFEDKYRRNPDPWGFATDPYEQQRYGAIVEALSGRRYRRAFEPGCSIGALTERLAECCDEVVAIDFSATAAGEARARCAGFPQVYVACGSLVDCELDGMFDLMVLSEIGYYFERDVWQGIVCELVKHLEDGGTVLAAHWLGVSGDHRISGDEVHEVLLRSSGLEVVHSERYSAMRLDRMVKR